MDYNFHCSYFFNCSLTQERHLITKRKCGVNRLQNWRFWNNLNAYKQYPTLVGIYLRIVYDTTSDERSCLPCVCKFSRFPIRVKSETLSSNKCMSIAGLHKGRKCFLHSVGYWTSNFHQIFLKFNIDRKILYKKIGVIFFILPLHQQT